MRIIFVFLCFFKFLFAESVDVSLNKDISLLEKSMVYVGEKDIQKNNFKVFSNRHLNTGVSHKYIWIKLDFKNPTNHDIKKVLVFSSPLLEKITLFSDDLKVLQQAGMAFGTDKHFTIPYFFELVFEKNLGKTYFLRVSSKYTPIDFSLYLKDKNKFLRNDRHKQFIDIFLLGSIFAMMLYSILLSVYLKDKSFFYYGLYLLALVYQQMTYLGITQIYFSMDFVKHEGIFTIPKLLFLIFTSALFAKHFLEANKFPKVELFYKSIMGIVFLELLFLNPEKDFSLNVVILTGAIFIFINFLCGIYAYKNGIKQARLFILGFGIVFLSYIMMIIDALGIVSVMVYFQNILIWTTAIEALLLSLAFADRYLILEKEKKLIDRQMFEELKYRKKLVLEEVELKTKQLNSTLKEKELLLQEVHHRVKNNLQVILSMIRLQSDLTDITDVKTTLNTLENRINAIAKTYSILLSKDSFQTINMGKYVDELIDDLVNIMDKKDVLIKKDIQMKLPIKKAIYIGLIINELVTNSFKYAFGDKKGIINIKLYEENGENILKITDNGKGYKKDKSSSSLGLKLINTIVKNQLKGDIELNSTFYTGAIVRFKA